MEKVRPVANGTANTGGVRARKKTKAAKGLRMGEPETDEEKLAESQRVNQLMFVYLFICAVITISWLSGVYGLSFIWIFGLIGLTFWIWRRKATWLLEEALREKEIVLHRRRNLRQSETAEWLNFVINRWWVFSASAISDIIKKNLEPLLQDIKPPILESIEVLSFSLGEKTPFIKYATVYEYADGGKRAMSFSSVIQPPGGLMQAQFYQVVVELDTALHCEDFNMIFRTRLGGKKMGMNLDIAVEQLNIAGKLQLIIHMDMDRAFPHISSVTLSFVEKPEVWFSIRVLKAVQMMEIPLLKNWIHSVVMGGLTEALVDPGKMDIKFERTGPTNIPEAGNLRRRAVGVLTVTLEGEYIRGTAFVDDTRYCQLRLNGQKRHTQHLQGVDEWRETVSFLVEDLKTDKLTIKCKCKFLLTLQTLAQFEIRLADHPLEHQPSAQVSLESKLSKSKLGGATVKLNVTMTFSTLPQIDPAIESGGMPASPLGYRVWPTTPPSDSVAGVLYVCVHNAMGLLGLDRNGFSDPYCVIYCNGKKLKTTHYVERTKNPRWDVSTEAIVSDYTHTILYFILYDWDGASPSEDDFLGSAHLVLSKDEPSVIRRSLTLGYNLLNVGQVENNNLGNVTVSAIFRPVPEVVASESTNPVQNPFTDHPTTYKNKGFINQAKQKLVAKRSSAVKNILATGGGIIELNIAQAKDLVAADSNGLSDPYCNVKVNGERKFTTNTKKKTLNPVWDEWVTLQLPKPEETLEITVWDKDAFFQKDFLGVVTFTLEDLKKFSVDNKAQSWFELQRTTQGWIQVFFKVISEDVTWEGNESMPAVFEEPEVVRSSQDAGSQQQFLVPNAAEQTTLGNSRAGSAPPEVNVPGLEKTLTSPRREGKTTAHSPVERSRAPDSEKSQKMSVKEEQDEDGRMASSLPVNSHQSQQPAMDTSFPPAPPSPADSSSSERSRRMQRSASDAAQRKGKRVRRQPARPASMSVDSRRDSQTSLPPPANSAFSGAPTQWITPASSVSSLAPGERFYWVQGKLLLVKGVGATGGHVYCKLRLDNRPLHRRTKKFSNGTVISKTSSINTGNNANFNHVFNVDLGYGVAKEALLIFDIKTSRREHLATKGYMIQDLLQDEQEMTKWVTLEHGVELEVFLSHSNHHNTLSGGDKRKRGLFGSFRRAKASKPKEQ